MLLEAGSNVFAKNSDNKTPRKVSNGNCVLTKLLRNFEEDFFKKNFFNILDIENEDILNSPRIRSQLIKSNKITNSNTPISNKNIPSNVLFTTVEDFSNIEENVSSMRINKLKDRKNLSNYNHSENKNEEFPPQENCLNNFDLKNNTIKIDNKENSENIFNTSTNEIVNANFPVKNINNLIVSRDGFDNRRKDFNKNNFSLNEYSKNFSLIKNLPKSSENNYQTDVFGNNNKNIKYNKINDCEKNNIVIEEKIDYENFLVRIREGKTFNYQNSLDKRNFSNDMENNVLFNTRSNYTSVNYNNNNVSNNYIFNNANGILNSIIINENEINNNKDNNNNYTNINNSSVNLLCDLSNFNSSLNVLENLPNNPNTKTPNVNDINYLNNMKGIDDFNYNNIFIRKKNHSLPNINRCNSGRIFTNNKNLIYTETKCKKINLDFHKEIILNYENNISEKFESLMNIKFCFNSIRYKKEDIISVIKIVIENLEIDYEENCMIFSEIANWVFANRIYSLLIQLESLVNRLHLHNQINYNFLMLNLENEIINFIIIMRRTEESNKKLEKIYYSNINKEKQIKNIKIPQSFGEKYSNNDLNINNDLLSSMNKNRENITNTNYSFSSQPQNESLSNLKDSINIYSKKPMFFRNNINFNPAIYTSNFTNKEKIYKSSINENSNHYQKDIDVLYENPEETYFINNLFNKNNFMKKKNNYESNKINKYDKDLDQFFNFNSWNIGQDDNHIENENFNFKNEFYINDKIDLENKINKVSNLQIEFNKNIDNGINDFNQNSDIKSEILFNIETIRKNFFADDDKIKNISNSLTKNDLNENIEMDLKNVKIGSPELSHNIFDNIFNNKNFSKSKRKFVIKNQKIIENLNTNTKKYSMNNKGIIKVTKIPSNTFYSNDFNIKNLYSNKILNENIFNNYSNENQINKNSFLKNFYVNSSNNKKILVNYENNNFAIGNNTIPKHKKINQIKNKNLSKPKNLKESNPINLVNQEIINKNDQININNIYNNNNSCNTFDICNIKNSNFRKNSNNRQNNKPRKDSKSKPVLNPDKLKKFDINEKINKVKQSFTFSKDDKITILGGYKNENNINISNNFKNKIKSNVSDPKRKISYYNGIMNNIYNLSKNNNFEDFYHKDKNNLDGINNQVSNNPSEEINDKNIKMENNDNENDRRKMKVFPNLIDDSVYKYGDKNRNINYKKKYNFDSEDSLNNEINNKNVILVNLKNDKNLKQNKQTNLEINETENINKEENDIKKHSEDFHLLNTFGNNNIHLLDTHNEIYQNYISNKENHTFPKNIVKEFVYDLSLSNKKEKEENYDKYVSNEFINLEDNIINNKNPSETIDCFDKSFLMSENSNITSSFQIKCVRNISNIKNANSYFKFENKNIIKNTRTNVESDIYNINQLESKNPPGEIIKNKNFEYLRLQNLENKKKSIELIKKNIENENDINIKKNSNLNLFENDKNNYFSLTKGAITNYKILDNESTRENYFKNNVKIDNHISLLNKKPIKINYLLNNEISQNKNFRFIEYDNENCNLVDSSRSILKNEEHLESKNSNFNIKSKNDILFKNSIYSNNVNTNNNLLYQNEYFTSLAPKKIDSSLFDFEI